MRTVLYKKYFTKPERIIGRLLQERGIPFRSKVLIGGREIDFIINNIAIEVDGHEQDGYKNHNLAKLGYTPIHFSNSEVYNNRQKVLETIINLL